MSTTHLARRLRGGLALAAGAALLGLTACGTDAAPDTGDDAPPAASELGHNTGFDAAPGAAPGGRTGVPFFSHTWAAPNAAAHGVSFGAPGSDRGTVLAPSALPAPLQLGTGPIRFGSQLPSAPAPSSGESDIIPTAIVIKNIPFNIKREQLLHVIVRRATNAA